MSSTHGQKTYTEQLYKEIEDKIGHLGWYQTFLISIIMVMKLTCSMSNTIPVFAAAIPKFRCRNCFDDINFYNLSETEILDYFYRDSENEYIDHCEIDGGILSQNDSHFEISDSRNLCCENSDLDFSQQCLPSSKPELTNCDDYIFDDSFYKETIITEWNLVCGKRYLADLSTTMYLIGSGMGTIFAATINNFFGRKKSTIISILLLEIGGVYSAFAPNIENYIVSKFIYGVAYSLYYVTVFTHLMEIPGERYRTQVSAVYGVFYSLCVLLVSYPIVLFIRNWRYMQLVISLSSLPILVLYAVFNLESWRWLMSKNRPEEAYQIAEKIYLKQHNLPNEVQQEDLKIIKNGIYEIMKINNQNSAKNQEKTYWENIQMLFGNFQMNKINLLLAVVWVANPVLYTGLALNVGSLPGNDIANSAILGMMDVPAYFIMVLLIDRPKIGRKNFQVYGLFLSALCCILSTVFLELNTAEDDVTSAYKILGRIFAYLGKGLCGATYQVAFQWTSEIYSTDVRSTGFSYCNLIGKSFSSLSPFIISLSEINTYLPGAVFSFLGILGGVGSLFLPETLDQPLLLTVNEAATKYSRK